MFEATDKDVGHAGHTQFSDHNIKNQLRRHFHIFHGGEYRGNSLI